MLRRLVGKTLARLSLAPFALFLVASVATAQEGCGSCTTGCAAGCAPHCQRFHCPPILKWCTEGKPRICFQCGCPKPICCPCEAPNWGYYQKCWTPWPWSPDWSHCPVPPPASNVFPGMIPAAQGMLPETGPNPRSLEARPPL
jgi:hypothetical protein